MNNEEWQPIPGYEGYYEASNIGRVRGIGRYVQSARGQRWQEEKILSPAICKSGYQTVFLRRGDRGRSFYVHRAVLLAFIGEPPPGAECCHTNGDPADNRLSNLRWDSKSANQIDKVLHGRHHNAIKTHCKRGHELAGANLRVEHDGRRRCRTCSNQLLNERRRKARVESVA